jgi:hypothetical protein
MKKFQKQIGKTVGKIIKPGNAKKTFVDENKLRSKGLNSIKLANGEEIITENFEEINRNVIRAELNVIVLRNLIKQFQTLYRTIRDPEQVKDQKYRRAMDEDFNVQRFRAEFFLTSGEH